MKAIIVEGVFKSQSEFIRANKFNEINNVKDATDQQWYDWGFREYVVPAYTENQMLGELFLDKDNDIYTYLVIDKTPEVIQEELDNYIKSLVLHIESDTDNLIKAVVGERANEYLIAEQEAIIFKEASYPELDIPLSISSDMVANNRTAQEACDLILLMSENWKTIQGVLRAKRLMTKAQIKQITVKADAEVIITDWDDFITSLRAQIID